MIIRILKTISRLVTIELEIIVIHPIKCNLLLRSAKVFIKTLLVTEIEIFIKFITEQM